MPTEIFVMELNKIDLGKKGMESVVGNLESDILCTLWDKNGKVSCREVFGKIKKKHKVAYSTVVVYLDRMYQKKLVDRKTEAGKGGVKYLYSPKYSRDEFISSISKKFLNYLKRSFGEASIAYLKKNI